MSRLPPMRGAGLLCCALVLGALLTFCGNSGTTHGGPTTTDGGEDGALDGGHLDGGGNGNDSGPILGGPDGGGDSSSGTDAGSVHSSYPCPGCSAFPNLGGTICLSTTLGPAVVAYPVNGLLLPPNMNVLEVQFVPPTGATLFEVDFENGVTDVRVETMCTAVPDVRGGPSRGCGVTLSQQAWNDIANTNRGGDAVTVTVRATINGSCVTTSLASIAISFAEQDLAGGIYYWQSATYGGVGGKTGGIYSHDFGTFDPTPTPFYTAGASGTCVGCHNVSRDGFQMALTTDDPDGDDEFADEFPHVLNVPTRTITGGAKGSPGFQTFTHDHALMVASTFKTDKNQGFDVSTGDGATLLQTASPLSAAQLATGMLVTQPDLSADDKSIVFVVPGPGTGCSMGMMMMMGADAGASCVSQQGDTHFFAGSLYAASFSTSAAMGTTNPFSATSPLLVSTGMRNYYYPSFSPDGNFVVFDDAPQPGNTATTNSDGFYNRDARVKLIHYPAIPNAAAMDLPALNLADGLSNSWPRWSPFVQTYKGHQILWVTFSSNRDYGLHLVNAGFDNCYPPEGPTYDQPQPLSKQNTTYTGCAQPQIWMAAVIVDTSTTLDSTDRSFPAFWLPFQDVTSHNHSAQWVEAVQPLPGTDGGTGGGDGGTGNPEGGSGTEGGTCGESGASCGSTSPLCCSDVVCCAGVCTDGSNCVQ
jgi:hypothetical protein